MSKFTDEDYITIFLVDKGFKRFGVRVDTNLTLRLLTKAIQNRKMYGVAKENLRLYKWQDDRTWNKLYSGRSGKAYNKSTYEKTLPDLGIIDGSWLKVEWVLGRGHMIGVGLSSVVAIPVAIIALPTAPAVVW
jgi:hypothetical protein